MGSTLNAYLNKFEEFKALPAGQSFTIRVTDQEATEVAKEYLAENKASVSQRIQKRTGLKLSVDNPSVSFRNDEILNSVVEGPLKKGTGIVEEYAEIRSFKVTDGAVVLEAVRK